MAKALPSEIKKIQDEIGDAERRGVGYGPLVSAMFNTAFSGIMTKYGANDRSEKISKLYKFMVDFRKQNPRDFERMLYDSQATESTREMYINLTHEFTDFVFHSDGLDLPYEVREEIRGIAEYGQPVFAKPRSGRGRARRLSKEGIAEAEVGGYFEE